MPAIHHTLPASGATTSTKAVVSKTTANTEQGAPFLGKVEVPTEKEVYRFNASIGANNTERVIQSGDKEPANQSNTECETKSGDDNQADPISTNTTKHETKSGDDGSDGGGQGENPANGSRTESKTKAGNDSGDKESDDSNESEFDAFEVRICV